MFRKTAYSLIVFVFLSMLAACITAPILYNKSRRESKTTVPSTTTETGELLTSLTSERTTRSYRTSHATRDETESTSTQSSNSTDSTDSSISNTASTAAPSKTTSTSLSDETDQYSTAEMSVTSNSTSLSAISSTAATTTTTTTTTTTDKTKNPCYDHVCKNGETCFEIDNQATCVSGTIGFLTHDKMMTVKCGKASSMYMKTRHECIGQEDNTKCAAEKVEIHHIDFAAAPNRNEYYIDTHPYDGKTRAMYHKKTSHKDYQKVIHVETKNSDSSKYGEAWFMDKIECGEDECPYFIRAAGDRSRGWKRQLGGGDGHNVDLKLDTIDETNDKFKFYIQVQIL